MTDTSKYVPMVGIATVRLVIDGLKHSIIQALETSEGTWRETVRVLAEQAVTEFDFAGQVRREVEASLHEQIRQTVRIAVQQALSESKALVGIVERAVADALRRQQEG